MKPIEQEFADQGIVRGGLLLLRARDALNMVRRCREDRVKVLGLDGFRLTEQTTQPIMNCSIDLANADARDVWSGAESFLTAQLDSDLYLEVVIEP